MQTSATLQETMICLTAHKVCLCPLDGCEPTVGNSQISASNLCPFTSGTHVTPLGTFTQLQGHAGTLLAPETDRSTSIHSYRIIIHKKPLAHPQKLCLVCNHRAEGYRRSLLRNALIARTPPFHGAPTSTVFKL